MNFCYEAKYFNLYTVFTNGGRAGASDRPNSKTRRYGIKITDLRGRDWLNMSILLNKDDIPGSSLAGRNPAELKSEELRFWLKCRNDPAKGLLTNAQLVR